MSAIALSWVATIKVGNQTAKQLLQFYASHNFNRPGFEFKNKTLAQQLEVSERAIRDAHKLLIDKGLIKRVPQYGKDGSQLSTITYLEIPDSIADNFFKGRGGEELAAGGGGTSCHPREELAATLNSNINNKKNKSLCVTRETKKSILCPIDFKPNASHYVIGKNLGVNVDEEVPALIDWSYSKGEKRLDWDRTFNNWLRNERKFNQSRGQNNGKVSKSGIMFETCKETYNELKREAENQRYNNLLTAEAY